MPKYELLGPVHHGGARLEAGTVHDGKNSVLTDEHLENLYKRGVARRVRGEQAEEAETREKLATEGEPVIGEGHPNPMNDIQADTDLAVAARNAQPTLQPSIPMDRQQAERAQALQEVAKADAEEAEKASKASKK